MHQSHYLISSFLLIDLSFSPIYYIVIRRLTILLCMTPHNLVSNEQLATIAKAIAHPARIQIIRLLLSKPSCIGGEITSEVGLAQSTVSEHLRILKAAEIVTGEIEHPRVCYSLNPEQLLPLLDLLQQIARNRVTNDEACCVSTNDKMVCK